MTEPNSPNHWDFLASELGATSPSEEPAAQQPSPVAPPPVHKPVHHERKAAPQTADWDLLASELGIAPAAPAAPPAAAAITPPAPAPAAPSAPEPVEPELESILPWTPKPDPLAALFGPLPEREPHETPPSEKPEESPNFFDERFDFEEPYDLLESSDSEKTEEATGEESESTEEKRPRRRRRRRRRGRGGEQRRETETTSDERSDESISELGVVSAEEESADVDQRQPVGEESEREETGERRPRRRRSRRGRNRRETESAPRASGEKAGSDEDLDHAEPHDVGDEFDLGEEGSAEGEQPARMGFRGIPTWDEAVGLLIDKNIEARSKRPAGGPHHNSHGNRGPRDNRGGGRGGKR